MKKLKRKFNKMNALLLSIVMFITMLTPYSTVFAAPVDQTANSDIVRSLELSYKLKSGGSFINLGAPYDIPDSSLIDSFRAIYGFEIKDNVNIDTGEPERTVTAGDFYMIDLPDELRITTPTNGSILGNGGRPIANYTFIQDIDESWSIKVEFTDYVDDLNEYEIHGNMQFDFTFDLSLVAQGTTETIYIPIDDTTGINLEITVPVPPPTTPTSVTKTVTSYNHQTRDLVWNVQLQPATGVFSGCTFTDTIDVTKHQLKSIRHGSITLVENVDYTYNSATGLLTYLIPNGRNGSSFQNIVITTSVNRDIYGNLTATTINNTANLSGGAAFVDIDSNQSTHTVTPNWIAKSGAVVEGNRIRWTINANTTNQSMYNAVITDNLAANLILDRTSVRLGSTVVNVYDDTHTPANSTEVYGIIVDNPDGTSEIKIYLPRGVANASTARQTITFITDVVAPATVTNPAPRYNNNAELDANFIGDDNGVGTISGAGTGTIGVNVPNVAIDKGNQTLTAEDRRNGTITWTLSAVSNLINYGASQIVDTLPNDQDYLADEIYWGSQKIDTTTEPKAEISVDGRTLTISFANPNALQTQQSFTIKTKIKQNVYGQNLDRNFTNQARVALFSQSTGLEVAAATDTHNVRIQNSVITKSTSAYTGNTTRQGENPRVNFSIVINSNLMELQNLKITDDLSQIITEFKRSSESSFSTINGVKWTYVPNSLQITKTAGTRDSLDLAAITSSATYLNDLISIDFGNGTTVNDSYTIKFTAELDIEQNSIFKENGTIRCRGNIAGIEGLGLNTGVISPPTGISGEIKNEILGKSGTHLIDAQQALWTINLNQYGSELNSTRVVDILPLGLTLDPTSIKLYTDVIGTNGNFVTGSQVEAQGVSVPFTYTYEAATDPALAGRYILTVNLPDNNLAYILRFATDIDNSILGTQINNSAYYVGESSVIENVNTTNVTLSSTVGGGSTTKTSLTVNKYNKDNDQAIDGALFSLYWLRGGNPEDPVFVRSLTTTSGSVVFRGLTIGEKYTIQETTAPTDYLRDNPDPIEVNVPIDLVGDLEPINFYNTPIKSGSWNPEAIKDLVGTGFVRPFHFEILDGDTQVFTGVTGDTLPNGRKTVDFTLSNGIAPEQLLNFSDDYIFPDDAENGTSHLVITKTLVMKEANTNLPGYVIDDNEYEFTIKVYNIKGQANLVVQIEDEEGNIISDDQGNFTPENIPIFFNEYSANGEFEFDVNKNLIGKELAAGQFTFNLYEGETLIDSATNLQGTLQEDGSYLGSVDFDKLEFTQADAGLRTYTIVEENSGLEGYTYDTSTYTVEIRITDNDDGTITTNIESITKNSNQENQMDVDTIEFKNSYTSLDLQITKYLKGKAMVTNEFSFMVQQINPEDGSKIGEEVIGKNNAKGNILFPDVTFNLEDLGRTFYFNVTEVDENKPVYTYDSTKYTITATVVQNEDGTLSLEQSNFRVGTLGLQAVDDFSFNNTYVGSIPQTGGMFLRYLLTTLTLTSIGTIFILKGRKLKKEEN